MQFLVTFVSLFFFFSSTIKILGMPKRMADFQLEAFFHRFGYDRTFMRRVGIGELFGAITVWFWNTHWIATAGAGLLVFITASALAHHFRFKTVQTSAPAAVMLISTAILFLSAF